MTVNASVGRVRTIWSVSKNAFTRPSDARRSQGRPLRGSADIVASAGGTDPTALPAGGGDAWPEGGIGPAAVGVDAGICAGGGAGAVTAGNSAANSVNCE